MPSEEGGRTLGATLAELRGQSHISLRNLSITTRIQEKYLAALEAGRYEALPDEIYVKSFVKSVARALGADPAPFLATLENELEAAGKLSALAPTPIRDIPTVALTVTPTIIKRAAIAAVAVSLLIGMALAVRATISPPEVALSGPEDGAITAVPTVEVAGVSAREADLRINGVRVTPTREGSFRETIDLHRGTNLIKITAKKRHSRETVMYRRVVYEPPNE